MNTLHTKAKEYFDLLNHSKFRRAKPYPGDEEMAIARIASSLEKSEPILLMMYWAKAERDIIAEPEKRAIHYLADNLAKLSGAYEPGILVDVVFVDTHVKFNGYAIPADCLSHVEKEFNAIFQTKPNLRARLSFSSDYLPFKPTKDKKAFEEFAELKFRIRSSDIAPEVRAALAPRSTRYYHRTNDMPEDVATMYYELCKWEQAPIGKAFPRHIFLTYNTAAAGGKKHFGVPANMPAICINSLPGRISDKPWNMDTAKLLALDQNIPLAALKMRVASVMGSALFSTTENGLIANIW